MALSIGVDGNSGGDGTDAGPEIDEIEIPLLLEAVYRRYGYDFRNYALSPLRRRIWGHIRSERLSTVSALQDRVLHDPESMERLAESLTVTLSAMFRDPDFHVAFRKKVVPLLRTYPFFRIWLAGCSTGEEAYSMAILLQEEGLQDRCQIYATDMSASVVQRAKSAIFPIAHMQEYTDNYIKAGGRKSFSEYYTASYNNAIFSKSIRDRIVFAQHNMVTDRPFNEFNVILCRNVLIYFNPSLQDRVHELLYSSLGMFGVLAIGNTESLGYTVKASCYEELDGVEKLYRKVR